MMPNDGLFQMDLLNCKDLSLFKTRFNFCIRQESLLGFSIWANLLSLENRTHHLVLHFLLDEADPSKKFSS